MSDKLGLASGAYCRRQCKEGARVEIIVTVKKEFLLVEPRIEKLQWIDQLPYATDRTIRRPLFFSHLLFVL